MTNKFNINITLVIIIVAIISTSCSTVSHTASYSEVETKVYNLTVADMKVEKDKCSATANWNWNPFSVLSLKEQKKTAVAEALKQTNADLLVEPEYIVKRRGFMRGGTVTVTGYPAKYENFRSMTLEDAQKIATLDGSLTYVYPVLSTSIMPTKVKAKTHKKSKKNFLRKFF